MCIVSHENFSVKHSFKFLKELVADHESKNGKMVENVEEIRAYFKVCATFNQLVVRRLLLNERFHMYNEVSDETVS